MKIYDNGIRNYSAKEIMNSKIDKKRKNSTTKKRGYFIYKIRYSGYDKYNSTFI
jgi:hypothetical protein